MSYIITLIKTGHLGSIRRKLIAMYLLNVTDIIFTIFLVNTGMFVEANAIMAPFVNSSQLSIIIVKIVIPFVLLICVYKRMKDATEKQLYQSNFIINGCLIFYALINIFHVIWSILYIVMII